MLGAHRGHVVGGASQLAQLAAEEVVRHQPALARHHEQPTALGERDSGALGAREVAALAPRQLEQLHAARGPHAREGRAARADGELHVAPGRALELGLEQGAGRRVPHPRVVVVRRADHELARDRDRVDRLGSHPPRGVRQRAGGGGVERPDAHRAVGPRADQRRAAVGEGEVSDPEQVGAPRYGVADRDCVVPGHAVDHLPGLGVPHPDRGVGPARGEPAPVGRDCQGVHAALVPEQGPLQAPAVAGEALHVELDAPQPDRAARAGGGDQPARGAGARGRREQGDRRDVFARTHPAARRLEERGRGRRALEVDHPRLRAVGEHGVALARRLERERGVGAQAHARQVVHALARGEVEQRDEADRPGVPLRGLLVAGRQQPRARGRERERVQRAGVGGRQLADPLAGDRVPHARAAVGADREQQPVGRERQPARAGEGEHALERAVVERVHAHLATVARRDPAPQARHGEGHDRTVVRPPAHRLAWVAPLRLPLAELGRERIEPQRDHLVPSGLVARAGGERLAGLEQPVALGHDHAGERAAGVLLGGRRLCGGRRRALRLALRRGAGRLGGGERLLARLARAPLGGGRLGGAGRLAGRPLGGQRLLGARLALAL